MRKALAKTIGKQRFDPLRALSGRLSKLSWAVLGASSWISWGPLKGPGVLEASEGSRSPLGGLWRPPAPALGLILGLFLGGLELSEAPLRQSWDRLG
eukprot:7474090-Pyramimonas_sp.AAC.1